MSHSHRLDFERIRDFGQLELLARQMVDGFITGLHKSPYHGFSVEFAEHSLYNPGESTRHLDWKLYARTDRLYTKKYEEETNLRALILLDVSSSMYYPEPDHGKLGFGVVAAAALATMLQRQRDAVGLCTFADKTELITPLKSTSTHLHNLLLLLQRQWTAPEAARPTALSEVVHEVAERLHKRSMVIVLSDLLEQQDPERLLQALQHLKHNHHEVLLFHVADFRTELELDLPERPYLFVDLETGQQLKAQPSQVRQAYRQQVQQRLQDIRMRCGQYDIDLVAADCRQPVDQVLLPYLIMRKRMR